MGYYIGSFNLCKLGRNFSKKNLFSISRMIKGAQFDILALQEVFSIEGIEQLVQLLNIWGSKTQWAYAFANKKTLRNIQAEGYAFIWNCQKFHLLEEKNNSHASMINAHYSRSLKRPPMIGRFIPVDRKLPLEIRVINTHIVFSRDEYNSNKIEQSALDDRKEEYRKLSRKILPSVHMGRDGGNRSVYTFLAGDYNLTLVHCSEIDKNFVVGSPVITRQQNKTTLAQDNANLQNKNRAEDKGNADSCTTEGSSGHDQDEDEGNADSCTTEGSSGHDQNEDEGNVIAKIPKKAAIIISRLKDPYANDYDHFSFSPHESQYVHMVDRIDAPRQYCWNDFEFYKKNISDHVPVILHLDIKQSVSR